MIAAKDLTVALLMGGRSRRMGADKAHLTHPATGQPFYRRQLALLESLEPSECFVSLREGQGPPELSSGWKLVRDEVAEAGPLGGVTACLRQLRTDFLLVLGVDLGAMQRDLLVALCDRSGDGCGAVFERPAGFYEPLAAIYPRESLEEAEDFLARGELRLQRWVAALAAAGAVKAVGVTAPQEKFFLNVNDRKEYEALGMISWDDGSR